MVPIRNISHVSLKVCFKYRSKEVERSEKSGTEKPAESQFRLFAFFSLFLSVNFRLFFPLCVILAHSWQPRKKSTATNPMNSMPWHERHSLSI